MKKQTDRDHQQTRDSVHVFAGMSLILAKRNVVAAPYVSLNLSITLISAENSKGG
jgi:hypothetical protein